MVPHVSPVVPHAPPVVLHGRIRYGCLRTGETKRLSSRKEGGEIAVEILGELDLKDEEGGYQVGRTKVRCTK